MLSCWKMKKNRVLGNAGWKTKSEISACVTELTSRNADNMPISLDIMKAKKNITESGQENQGETDTEKKILSRHLLIFIVY